MKGSRKGTQENCSSDEGSDEEELAPISANVLGREDSARNREATDEMLEDILINNNVGPVHPYHTVLISQELQTCGAGTNTRLATHRVKCIAPPHLLLSSSKLRERLLWESEGAELCKDWSEVCYAQNATNEHQQDNWEYKVHFTDPKFVQPLCTNSVSDEEEFALNRMKEKWMQAWER